MDEEDSPIDEYQEEDIDQVEDDGLGWLRQRAFDRVAQHLLTQMAQCVGGEDGTCQYRGAGGLKCAIGCLIPDDRYVLQLEGMAASQVTSHIDLGPDVVFSDKERIREFLDRLQEVHDYSEPEEWASELMVLASGLNLDTTVLAPYV